MPATKYIKLRKYVTHVIALNIKIVKKCYHKYRLGAAVCMRVLLSFFSFLFFSIFHLQVYLLSNFDLCLQSISKNDEGNFHKAYK